MKPSRCHAPKWARKVLARPSRCQRGARVWWSHARQIPLPFDGSDATRATCGGLHYVTAHRGVIVGAGWTLYLIGDPPACLIAGATKRRLPSRRDEGMGRDTPELIERRARAARVASKARRRPEVFA